MEGNLFAKFSDMGIECETWSNTVEAAAINAHQTEDGKVVFYISTMLYQQWTTMRHSWTEFYGPCGHKTSDDPSGILQPPTIRGDFSVDFWRSAGKVIDYDAKIGKDILKGIIESDSFSCYSGCGFAGG